jgi:hypothetical protein
MREAFTTQNFRADSLAIIGTANNICAEYQAQGYNLTLRQVYYQFVARGLLANKDTNYKRLGSIINDARLAGLMDWSYIQDRTRNVRGGFGGYANPGAYIESVADGYVEAIWRGQDYRPEVWVEKDALVDVVARGCAQDRVPHFSCRGYVSQSEMYEAAKRMERYDRRGLTPLVIHLGDHDPSGIDMTRDIRDRLSLMANTPVEVRRIALTMEQIETYDPPPNPAKLTDSRGEGYVAEYGYESWELDALEPSVITALIQAELDTIVDRDLLEERRAHEAEQEDRIRVIADRWDDLETHWDDVLDVIG